MWRLRATVTRLDLGDEDNHEGVHTRRVGCEEVVKSVWIIPRGSIAKRVAAEVRGDLPVAYCLRCGRGDQPGSGLVWVAVNRIRRGGVCRACTRAQWS